MEDNILTPLQKNFLAVTVKDSRTAHFYLTGGTALAVFYLKHRVSDDLDFFSRDPVDSLSIRSFVDETAKQFGASSVRYERLHDRQIYFLEFSKEELKVEFTQYPFEQFEASQSYDGVLVDSFRDLSANKLMAMLDRFDPKDFVDLRFIFDRRPLRDVRADVEKKFGVTIDPIFLGGELMKVKRIVALPKMLIPLTADELIDYFEKIARTLKSEVIK